MKTGMTNLNLIMTYNQGDIIKILILCAGKGLRYGGFKPKGLSLIGNKPIIHHVMEIYTRQGYRDFILILGYKHNDIERYFKSFDHGYNIEFTHIKENMNKGGALTVAKDILARDHEDNFFCTYCDCLANINLENLIQFHNSQDNIATITTIKPYHEFGIVVFGNDKKIIEFREKPQMNEWTNGGFFIFNKKIFNYILSPEDNLETDIFNRLVKKNKIGGYKHQGFWNTVNTQKDEELLNELCDKSIKENTELEWYKII